MNIWWTDSRLRTTVLDGPTKDQGQSISANQFVAEMQCGTEALDPGCCKPDALYVHIHHLMPASSGNLLM